MDELVIEGKKEESVFDGLLNKKKEKLNLVEYEGSGRNGE